METAVSSTSASSVTHPGEACNRLILRARRRQADRTAKPHTAEQETASKENAKKQSTHQFQKQACQEADPGQDKRTRMSECQQLQQGFEKGLAQVQRLQEVRKPEEAAHKPEEQQKEKRECQEAEPGQDKRSRMSEVLQLKPGLEKGLAQVQHLQAVGKPEEAAHKPEEQQKKPGCPEAEPEQDKQSRTSTVQQLEQRSEKGLAQAQHLQEMREPQEVANKLKEQKEEREQQEADTGKDEQSETSEVQQLEQWLEEGLAQVRRLQEVREPKETAHKLEEQQKSESDRGEMKLFLKRPTGDVFSVVIAPTETIRTLKLLVCVTKGFAVNQQRLVFAGVPLNDAQHLNECRITDQSIIHLILSKPCHTPAKLTPSKNVEMGDNSELSDSVAKVKVKVRLQNDDIVTIEVYPSDSVAMVKTRLMSMVCPGIAPMNHELFHGKALLGERATVKSLKIPKNTILRLVDSSTMQIRLVTPQNQAIVVKINQHKFNESIEDFIPSALTTHFGVTPDMTQLRVYQDGRLLHLQQKIWGCDFKEGATLHLYTPSMCNTIKTRKSGVFEVSTQPGDEATDLVVRVYEMTGEIADLNMLCFTFRGMIMDNHKPLSKYGIHHRDHIELVLRPPIKINVIRARTPLKKLIIKPSASVMVLKSLIEQLYRDDAFPEDSAAMTLTHDNVKLDDSKTLQFYDIQTGSAIFVECPLKLILENTVTGRKYALRVDSDQAVHHLKKVVFELTKVPVEEQVLSNKAGSILKDDHFLEICDIQDGVLLLPRMGKAC